MSDQKPSLTVIVKTTHECNMECKYCLTGDSAEKGQVDIQTLENMTRKVSEYNASSGRTTFIWHGGEPLLLGIDFYKQALDIQKRFKHHIFYNDLQTNGLLLDEFIDFFLINDFHVGTSIDGPPHIHDKIRVKKEGFPSLEHILKSYNEARSRGLCVGVICVLNKVNASDLKSVYTFFKENEINHQINIQLPAGRALKNKELDLKPYEAGRAMMQYFDLWFHDYAEPILDVGPFDQIIHNLGASKNQRIKSNYPVGCIFRNQCATSYIAIVPGGNVYPCGRFAGTPEFYMGNINTDSMEKIMNGSAHNILMRRMLEGVDECKKCEYQKICNSGCPDSAYLHRGSIMRKDGMCASNKMLFRHIEKAVLKELNATNR